MGAFDGDSKGNGSISYHCVNLLLSAATICLIQAFFSSSASSSSLTASSWQLSVSCSFSCPIFTRNPSRLMHGTWRFLSLNLGNVYRLSTWRILCCLLLPFPFFPNVGRYEIPSLCVLSPLLAALWFKYCKVLLRVTVKIVFYRNYITDSLIV